MASPKNVFPLKNTNLVFLFRKHSLFRSKYFIYDDQEATTYYRRMEGFPRQRDRIDQVIGYPTQFYDLKSSSWPKAGIEMRQALLQVDSDLIFLTNDQFRYLATSRIQLNEVISRLKALFMHGVWMMSGNEGFGMARRGNRWRIVGWGIAAILFLLPLVAMQFTDEVNWDLIDFIIFGAMLLAAGGALELASRMMSNKVYRAAVAVAVIAAFILIWVNGAVGII